MPLIHDSHLIAYFSPIHTPPQRDAAPFTRAGLLYKPHLAPTVLAFMTFFLYRMMDFIPRLPHLI